MMRRKCAMKILRHHCSPWVYAPSCKSCIWDCMMCWPAGASDNVAPHLAAALQASGGGAQAKVQRLGAVGRVRHTGILNGVIPGSSAAAAAVNLYNGSSGAPPLAQAGEQTWLILLRAVTQITIQVVPLSPH